MYIHVYLSSIWKALFISCNDLYQIRRLLIDNGADILAVNNEGEIPVDLAEEKEMEEFLEEEMEKLGSFFLWNRIRLQKNDM